MKKGETYPVRLNEYQVADAVIVEIDGDQAILEIPATRIVMGIHSSLGEYQDPNATDRRVLGPQEQDGGDARVAQDPARAALEAEGIELDEDDDQIIEGRSGASSASEASLKEMNLDGID